MRMTCLAAAASLGGGRRWLWRGGLLVTGSERAAKSAFDALGYPRKGGFTIERRKNGAANKSRAAQACKNGAAEPLHGDAAAVDDGGFGSVRQKRRLMTKVNDPRLASSISTACCVQSAVPQIPATGETLRIPASDALGR